MPGSILLGIVEVCEPPLASIVVLLLNYIYTLHAEPSKSTETSGDFQSSTRLPDAKRLNRNHRN